jgi:3-oxoacyl-[acyl-carrier-protein] synthase II
MEHNGRRRVVITGLGAVTPLGNDLPTTWENLLAAVSPAAPITAFDASAYPVTFACEANGFDPTVAIDHKQARRMGRYVQLAVVAAWEAKADAGLEIDPEAFRIGASVATAMGGLTALEETSETLRQRGPDRVNPFAVPTIIPNMSAAWVSIELGTRGPLVSQCTACAASQMSIGDGLDQIRLGRADVMLCGGSEAAITPTGVAGFAALRALSRRNDDPAHASRPFDAERDGFVMGEAGAVLVLEELDHARARDAKIYAELIGYGLSSDSQHITDPDPTGHNPARAMRMALTDAGVAPDEVDYVNAHGTSTPVGDSSEVRVLKEALGEDVAARIPVSSTKGATGHCLGAAGAVEAIFSTLAIHEGVVPPTINYEVPDPDCDLDVVPNEARKADVRVAVSNSFGFGGHNATIVLRRFED